jgi:hypothetical protein
MIAIMDGGRDEGGIASIIRAAYPRRRTLAQHGRASSAHCSWRPRAHGGVVLRAAAARRAKTQHAHACACMVWLGARAGGLGAGRLGARGRGAACADVGGARYVRSDGAARHAHTTRTRRAMRRRVRNTHDPLLRAGQPLLGKARGLLTRWRGGRRRPPCGASRPWRTHSHAAARSPPPLCATAAARCRAALTSNAAALARTPAPHAVHDAAGAPLACAWAARVVGRRIDAAAAARASADGCAISAVTPLPARCALLLACARARRRLRPRVHAAWRRKAGAAAWRRGGGGAKSSRAWRPGVAARAAPPQQRLCWQQSSSRRAGSAEPRGVRRGAAAAALSALPPARRMGRAVPHALPPLPLRRHGCRSWVARDAARRRGWVGGGSGSGGGGGGGNEHVRAGRVRCAAAASGAQGVPRGAHSRRSHAPR